ncbi:MAG: DHH family phosphoesterase [Campylobacterales bacterium]|nr:DHH family phosphoesterase [Campylobacterales bacterium]
MQSNLGALKQKLDDAKAVTILSHINPDPDALGTALGIYALLVKDKSKKVEVVNVSKELPLYLDFLPYFKQVKHKIDYPQSLIISCDCGSIDRLGFDLSGREIINIDHHQSNTCYGTLNFVMPEYASSSQVAYKIFKSYCQIHSEAATCFYTALLSDTRYFTTTSVNHEVFTTASELVQAGADAADVAYHFTQRRSLASLRILESALGTLELHEDARIASIVVTRAQIEASGATMPDLDGIVDYARSLATVQIAFCVMETDEGIRVSLRSKGLDVSKVAMAFNGGGHKVAAGFMLKQSGLQETIDTILQTIQTLGLINEKKIARY